MKRRPEGLEWTTTAPLPAAGAGCSEMPFTRRSGSAAWAVAAASRSGARRRARRGLMKTRWRGGRRAVEPLAEGGVDFKRAAFLHLLPRS
jgi:hypothetical protein